MRIRIRIKAGEHVLDKDLIKYAFGLIHSGLGIAYGSFTIKSVYLNMIDARTTVIQTILTIVFFASAYFIFSTIKEEERQAKLNANKTVAAPVKEVVTELVKEKCEIVEYEEKTEVTTDPKTNTIQIVRKLVPKKKD